MAKTQGLAEKKKNRNMEAVVHAALHYFEENGYDNTTVDQLCDVALISSSTFFNYFGTKEKIVELIMLDGLNDYKAYAEQVRAEIEDPFEAVKAVLNFVCDASAKYCNTVAVFHRTALQNEQFRQLEQVHNTLCAELVLDAFQRAGKTCPLSKSTLRVLLGGCFTDPFLVLPPADACKAARTAVLELVAYLSR